jgi:hypothetical protein
MREFALLIQPLKDVPLQSKRYSFGIVKDFPGSSRFLTDEEIVTDGELEVVNEDKKFREFEITLKYKRRQTQISSDRPEVTGKFKLWQHMGGLAVAIDSDRKISEVAAAFVSVAQHKELRAVRLLRMNRSRFLALKSHAIELGGKVTMLHLRHGKDRYGPFSTLQRHGDLESTDVEELLKISKKVKRVGFSIPNLMGESYSFWVADWGVGAIYRPTSLIPHEIAGLLEFFEGALLHGKLDDRIEVSS